MLSTSGRSNDLINYFWIIWHTAVIKRDQLRRKYKTLKAYTEVATKLILR